MNLSDYVPARRDIKIDETQTLSVRGIGFSEVQILVETHFPDLDGIVELWEKFGDVSGEDFGPLVMAAVSQAPGLIANIIALAADQPTAAPKAMLIPGPVQIKIIGEILDLTFKEVGGVKKAMAEITAAMASTWVKNIKTKLTVTTKGR